MSPSLSLLTAARLPRPAARLAGSSQRLAATPLRVREWSPAEPIVLDVLDGARELRFVSAESLPVVVRALERTGHVVVVRYDGESQRLAYYAQRARIAGPARGPVVDDRPRPLGGPRQGDAAAVRDDEIAAATRGIDRPVPASDPAAETPDYEGEGSQQLSIGSVAVAPGAWWSAALSVPKIDGGTLFLRLERHGAMPGSYRGGGSMELSLPESEIDAVVTLLAGVVAQARRDGVLPPRAS